MSNQEIVQRTPQQELVAALRADDSRAQIAAALEGSGISTSKFVRVAVTAINENADLVKADRPSLFGALMRCAQDGLLPDAREAALVMFGQKATYMPMVGGLRKIAAEYGWSIIATVVHENDGFDPDPENAKANYKPVRLGMDPGDPVGAYAIGEHKDGRRLLEVMNLQEIEAVRATSRAKNSGPWVEWWGEMARKTVVRRLFKSLPLDPKDRERVERVLAAAGEDGVTLLYGAEDSPVEESAGEGQQAGGSGTDLPAPGSEDVPFEGEEPPPVSEENEPPSEEPTFSTGRYSGLTLAEVYASGKDGLSYCRWAFAAWKTQPLRGALDRFAEEHPDLKP